MKANRLAIWTSLPVLLLTPLLVSLCGDAQAGLLDTASLRIDFGRTGGATGDEAGYSAFRTVQEDIGGSTAGTQNFTAADIAATGTDVAVGIDWPNTTASTVRQAIDRSATTVEWTDTTGAGTVGFDLVGDWIGTDTRDGNGGSSDNGGNGAYDGVSGTPTYLSISLGNLATGSYSFLSYHFDDDNQYGNFEVEVSTDGGSTFGSTLTGAQQRGRLGSPNPNGFAPLTTTSALDAAGGIFRTTFAANGTDEVVLRFAILSREREPASSGFTAENTFFLINGFELAAIPEPSSALLVLAGLTGAFASRRR